LNCSETETPGHLTFCTQERIFKIQTVSVLELKLKAKLMKIQHSASEIANEELMLDLF